MTFQNFEKINSSAYVVDFPPDFGISLFFNIEDLIAYKGPNFSPNNSLLDEPSYEPISERLLLPPLPQIQLTHTANKLRKLLMIRLCLLDMVVTTDF